MPRIATSIFGSLLHPYDEGQCGAWIVDLAGLSHYCNESAGHEGKQDRSQSHRCRCGLNWIPGASREQTLTQLRAAAIRKPMKMNMEETIKLLGPGEIFTIPAKPERKAPEPKPEPILEVNTKRKMELD